MNYKITVLVENSIKDSDSKLIGEHGLSFLIEIDTQKILFDTGQAKSFKHNTKVLNTDLESIDTVVLSHGHYDHTGGLKYLTEQNSRFKLIAHPDIFMDKHVFRSEKFQYIGIPVDESFLIKKGVKVQFSEGPVEIRPGMMTTGEIPFSNDIEIVEPSFCIKNEELYTPDTMSDDQSLVITTRKGLLILMGCAHRGVLNTLAHAQKITGETQIHAVMGGFHLKDASESRIEKVIEGLRSFNIKYMASGHCTGESAMKKLQQAFPGVMEPLYSGFQTFFDQ
ncbi:MAG: MBL fold metallo-hydrolase [Desulfobacterales bacterium]|nr:MBL fold metallo-hydrolase [Desulfobacterales bacterium]